MVESLCFLGEKRIHDGSQLLVSVFLWGLFLLVLGMEKKINVALKLN